MTIDRHARAHAEERQTFIARLPSFSECPASPRLGLFKSAPYMSYTAVWVSQ